MSELTQKDIRKIKQIRGRTVNHPFSAPNIFYALFTLLLVALPLGIFFTPSFTRTNHSDACFC